MNAIDLYAEFTSQYQKHRPPVSMSAPLWNDLKHHERMAWEWLAKKIGDTLCTEKHIAAQAFLEIKNKEEELRIMTLSRDTFKRAYEGVHVMNYENTKLHNENVEYRRTISSMRDDAQELRNINTVLKSDVQARDAMIASLREELNGVKKHHEEVSHRGHMMVLKSRLRKIEEAGQLTVPSFLEVMQSIVGMIESQDAVLPDVSYSSVVVPGETFTAHATGAKVPVSMSECVTDFANKGREQLREHIRDILQELVEVQVEKLKAEGKVPKDAEAPKVVIGCKDKDCGCKKANRI